MVFDKDSSIVKSYLLLIKNGLRTMAEVPDLFNLREVVEECLAKQD